MRNTRQDSTFSCRQINPGSKQTLPLFLNLLLPYSCQSCPSPHQKQSPLSSPHPQEGGAQPSSHAGRRAAGAGSSSPPAVGSYGGARRVRHRQPLRAAPRPPPLPAVGSYGGARRARRRQPLRAAPSSPSTTSPEGWAGTPTPGPSKTNCFDTANILYANKVLKTGSTIIWS